MKVFVLLLLLGTAATLPAAEPATNSSRASVIVVVGAPGEDRFEGDFQVAATNWVRAAASGGAACKTIGLGSPGTNEVGELKAALEKEPKQTDVPLWLVLIGHGTFDGQDAKFNLRGPDLTATNLAGWLGDFQRPLLLLNTFSASGPFLNKLSGPGRVVVTATRSGSEQNYSRFARYLSEAIASQDADLDKDGQTSLLEAYLKACRDLAEFYKTEGRLATEHPLLDDNGDGLGTPPDWFRGIRAVKKAKEGNALDGLHAHQFHLVGNAQERSLSPTALARRNALEQSIEELRQQKSAMKEEAYYQQLEALFLELAKLYRSTAAGETRDQAKP